MTEQEGRYCEECGTFLGRMSDKAYRCHEEPDGTHVCADCWNRRHPEHASYDEPID